MGTLVSNSGLEEVMNCAFGGVSKMLSGKKFPPKHSSSSSSGNRGTPERYDRGYREPCEPDVIGDRAHLRRLDCLNIAVSHARYSLQTIYKRKTTRQTWLLCNMASAIEAVRKVMGLKRASKQYVVLRSALQRCCMIGEGSNTSAKKGLGMKMVFNDAMEREIVEHVKITEGMLYARSKSVLRGVF